MTLVLNSNMKLGKVKKKAMLQKSWFHENVTSVCALCERDIVKAQIEYHHLTPKSKGGTQTVPLHNICHRQIHALFNESELALNLNTIEKLRHEPELSKFITWVKKKPIDFKEKAIKSNRLKSF